MIKSKWWYTVLLVFMIGCAQVANTKPLTDILSSTQLALLNDVKEEEIQRCIYQVNGLERTTYLVSNEDIPKLINALKRIHIKEETNEFADDGDAILIFETASQNYEFYFNQRNFIDDDNKTYLLENDKDLWGYLVDLEPLDNSYETISSNAGFSLRYEPSDHVQVDTNGKMTIYLEEIGELPMIQIQKESNLDSSSYIQERKEQFEIEKKEKIQVQPNASFQIPIGDKNMEGLLASYEDEKQDQIVNWLVLVEKPFIYEFTYTDKQYDQIIQDFRSVLRNILDE